MRKDEVQRLDSSCAICGVAHEYEGEPSHRLESGGGVPWETDVEHGSSTSLGVIAGISGGLADRADGFAE